jgi:hypothetical protein
MSVNINFPNISAPTDSGKIEQIRSYLYQLADQLKWALNSLESGGTKVLQRGSKAEAKSISEEDAQATFNSIKSLIIRSADIVNAYLEETKERLLGKYVAQSDFGRYEEETEQVITTNAKGIERAFNNIQKITTDIENLEYSIIEVNAHIRTGLLSYDKTSGVPIYGLEVGQKNEIDGVEVFNKYARFTSDRLSFYDKNDTEVAYISDYKLYITNAHITGTLTIGRYELDTSNGLAIKWV